MRRVRRSLFLLRLGALCLAVALGVFAVLAIVRQVWAAALINKSYISAFEIKSAIDGTAPFDANNEAGNDQNDHNGIVRTFDHVNYNLSYITKLMQGETVVDEGNLMVEFGLDVDPSVAEFDQSTLNWLIEQKNTYYYSDGTSSATWDSSKTVTRQVLTGKRYLTVNENGANAIPGSGSLAAGLFIKAAKNGQKITPVFTVYMEGNADSYKKTVTSGTVTVSAAPRYDVQLTRSSIAESLAWYNLNDGTITEDKVDGATRGRVQIYGVSTGLYNVDADHGLRGIELPTGDITYDITLSEYLNSNGVASNVTDTDGYRPVLWDYSENMSGGMDYKGHMGRQMSYILSNTSYAAWAAPRNAGGTNDNDSRVYNGGNYNIVQDATNKNVYHVTIKDYKFDYKNLKFPNKNYGDSTTTVRYGQNIGMFSAGVVQALMVFPETVSGIETVRLDVTVSNFKASTQTQSTTTEMNTGNNTVSRTAVTYPSGSYSSALRVMDKNRSKYISSDFHTGDGYAAIGEELTIWDVMTYVGDGYLGSANDLIKFDPELVELIGTKKAIWTGGTSSLTKSGDITTLYAAKKDKTTWVDDKEMNDAIEENLVYFKDYDELEAQGYICVGVLVEFRNAELYNRGFHFSIQYRAKDTAEPGKVYQFKLESRAWRGDVSVPSWGDYSLGNNQYGIAQEDWTPRTYTTGYTAPTYYQHVDYKKAVYSNGTMSGGHTNGYQGGQSVLMIGAKNRIELTVNDKDSTATGTEISKKIYDLDKGERVVEFKVHPELNVASVNNESSSSNQKAKVTIRVVLPKDLKYIVGSSTLIPEEVDTDSTGKTTITWIVNDQQVGTAMEDIFFKATIGAAGTIDDVRNNDILDITSNITSTVDKRKLNVAYGNVSNTNIQVIKLATSSISKTVAEPLVESGADLAFDLHFGNSDDDFIENVRMVDILPFNADGRGSKFSGDHMVKKVILDFTNASQTYGLIKNTASVYYTNEASTRNVEGGENIVLNKTGEAWTKLTGGVANDAAKTITFDNLSLEKATALYFSLGDVQAKEYVDATIVLAPKNAAGAFIATNGTIQQPGDLYANNFFQYSDSQIGVVTSNNVFARVVHRSLSGMAWYDKDADGVRDEEEAVRSNVTVTLRDTSGNPVRDVLGNIIADTKTDATGMYSFDLLPAGPVVVSLAGGDFGLTVKGAGEDNAKDSDAVAVVAGGKLSTAKIDVTLPEANAMPAYNYESQFNDAGFTRSSVSLKKVSQKGETLVGAVFSAGGNTRYETEDGITQIDEIGTGSFSLTEVESPVGYKKGGPWTVNTAVDNNGVISTSVAGATLKDGYYEIVNNLNDSSIDDKIVKSSTTETVTAKEQAVDYEIDYYVELTDYMGDADITIVDKLPHPIVVDESELDGGEYDENELTITWTDEWKDINTYEGENSKHFTHNISLVYEGIEATDREMDNEAEGHIVLVDVETDPTIKDPEGGKDKLTTPIGIPGEITTIYLEDGTENPVCDSTTAVDLVGEPYTSAPIVCPGWELVSGPEEDEYVFEEEPQTIIYYYRKIENPKTVDNIAKIGFGGAGAVALAVGLFVAIRRRR